MTIRDTLKERGDRYGDFKTHAGICQDLKGIMVNTPSWDKCTPDKKQALEVIADKIARMLNGDPNYDDNWRDIIGYSQLVLDDLESPEHEGQTKMEFDKYKIGDIRSSTTCKWDDEILIDTGWVRVTSMEHDAWIKSKFHEHEGQTKMDYTSDYIL